MGAALQMIRLRPQTSSGSLGDGFYLTRRDKAESLARDAHRCGKGEGAVLEVEVELGRCKEIFGNDMQGQWRQEDYDSIHTTHWRTSLSEKQEWCVKDVSRCRVLSITSLGITAALDPGTLSGGFLLAILVNLHQQCSSATPSHRRVSWSSETDSDTCSDSESMNSDDAQNISNRLLHTY